MYSFRNILLAVLLVCGTCAFAQVKQLQDSLQQHQSSINKADSKGRKNGMWLLHNDGGKGEVAFYQFGTFDHGRKTGTWYKVDNDGELLAVEGYRNNVLNGEVKYYDKGRLYCIGNYRGLNPDHEFDTVWVEDPVTEQQLERIIPSERGTLRHGMWKFYNPESGRLIREEEYQVDDLIYRKDYNNQSADSAANNQRQKAVERRVKNQSALGKSVNYVNGQ